MSHRLAVNEHVVELVVERDVERGVGTLFDDAGLCVEIINDLLARYGLPLLSRERYEEIFTFPVRLYYERAGFTGGVEQGEQIFDRSDERRTTGSRPDDGSSNNKRSGR